MRRFVGKHGIALLLLLFFSLFASQKLFTDKFYTSHDGGGHIIRMIEFDEALREGQFPVRIAKRIHYGMGYPFFNFNYPFIYYFGETLHLFGLSFVNSFKALMVLSMIIGSIGMYVLTRPYFGMIGAFVSSFFFTTAPYKFLNLYVRGNVAESFALALIPLLLAAVDNFVRGQKYRYSFVIGIVSILILSHNITALIGIPLSIGFLFFLLHQAPANKRRIIKQFAFCLLASFILTSFFWVPVVVESSQTKLIELREDYATFFPTLREILYSPWGFGPYKQGDYPGKMSAQIGVVHELVFVAALIYMLTRIFRKKKLREKDMFLSFFLAVGMISIFLTLSISKFLWDSAPVLQFVQIPWRFIGYITFSAALCAGFLLSEAKKYTITRNLLVLLLILVVLYANRNHIRVNQYIVFENPFLQNPIYGPSTTSKDEHMPRLAPRVTSTPNPDGDLIGTSGISKRTIWRSNYHRFLVDVGERADFRDNTYYFPGWKAKIDGKDVALEYERDANRRLLVSLPPGKHTVEFFFTEPAYRLIADIVSLTTFFAFLLWAARFILRVTSR